MLHVNKRHHDYKIIRRVAVTAGVGFILLLTLLAYSAYIEPNLLRVKDIDIASEHIPPSFDDLTIVHFSDTHLGEYYDNEKLKKLVERVNELHPDMIIFTGDLFDHYSKYGTKRNEAQQLLKQMNAHLGKYAVYGNHDRGGGGSRKYEAYLEEAGFEVLVNETHLIELPNRQKIVLAGIDDAILGKPDIPNTLNQLRAEDFNIAVVHQPDLADDIANYPVDLQLSGHSHGGQVQTPWSKPIYTPPLAVKYVEGKYTIRGGDKPMQLYVNRGIGTTRLPIRFMNVPELTKITLVRKGVESY
ncbi:metallophosphoesterase [Paenibacillus agilis]|uniref:Metallophosphoesterase n=1 Tax=Paenibacillus agilis TaxID=3020863 RepID=A0A559J1W2_9BACL|nr:metallophosphoesterase [Paenibacillus agilis]TVX93836.1 metallophosphoesterase [Paenibacillus agilis]